MRSMPGVLRTSATSGTRRGKYTVTGITTRRCSRPRSGICWPESSGNAASDENTTRVLMVGIDFRPFFPGSKSLEASLWSRCVRALENELPEQQFNTWVRPLQSLEGDDALRLLAPNRFVVDWVRTNLLARLAELLRGFGVTDAAAITVEVGSRPAAPSSTAPTAGASAVRAMKSSPHAVGVPLNPDFTFDGFVEGKSNHFAKAAALQVAGNPGRAYNPLFIYGGVGLGKTHLMHAI